MLPLLFVSLVLAQVSWGGRGFLRRKGGGEGESEMNFVLRARAPWGSPARRPSPAPHTRHELQAAVCGAAFMRRWLRAAWGAAASVFVFGAVVVRRLLLRERVGAARRHPLGRGGGGGGGGGDVGAALWREEGRDTGGRGRVCGCDVGRTPQLPPFSLTNPQTILTSISHGASTSGAGAA